MRTHPLYLNGAFVAPGDSLPVRDPATGETFARMAVCGRPEVREALEHAQQAWAGWRQVSGKVRGDHLLRVAAEMGVTGTIGGAAVPDASPDGEEAEAPLEPGRTDVVRLMNLHKAKGLEAHVVVLAEPTGERDFAPDRHIERTPDGRARLVPVKRSSGATRKDGTVPHDHYFVWLEQLIAVNIGLLFPGMQVLAVYGGASIGQQIRELKRGVQIVVATPGRLIDLIERKAINLDEIEYVVLDEADEMLNMGFQEDIEFILKNTPKRNATWLFSATMPHAILRLVRRYMESPETVAIEPELTSADTVEQIYFEVAQRDKVRGLHELNLNTELAALQREITATHAVSVNERPVDGSRFAPADRIAVAVRDVAAVAVAQGRGGHRSGRRGSCHHADPVPHRRPARGDAARPRLPARAAPLHTSRCAGVPPEPRRHPSSRRSRAVLQPGDHGRLRTRRHRCRSSPTRAARRGDIAGHRRRRGPGPCRPLAAGAVPAVRRHHRTAQEPPWLGRSALAASRCATVGGGRCDGMGRQRHHRGEGRAVHRLRPCRRSSRPLRRRRGVLLPE